MLLVGIVQEEGTESSRHCVVHKTNLMWMLLALDVHWRGGGSFEKGSRGVLPGQLHSCVRGS